ncbi:MAG: RNA-binding protein [Gammaproteobacteria bacterium]|jgi:RNA recognition motif-containing protein
MKKLYVGNLPYSVTEESLESLFSQFGQVESVVLIKDRETGRTKGFGFVEFKKQSEAEAALKLNRQDFEGRPLKVNMAKPKESSGGGKGRCW